MTGLDWLIVAVVVVMAAGGAMQGFIVGALSLAGFAAGAVAGARLAPLLLHEGSSSPYAPVLALGGATLMGFVAAGGLGGLGARLRARVRPPGTGLVDGLLGAALSACLALALAWVLSAVALQTPGARGLRHDIQRSVILRQLNAALPPSGPILHLLARFDPGRSFSGPPVDVPAPRAAIARDPDVRAAFPGVVRVIGTACGLGVEGSGWIAGAGLVVTNAHVVAGERDTRVQAGGEGPELDAVAVRYDPGNDIAVLRVNGLPGPILPTGEPRRGAAAAILGYPLDGPFRVRPARLGDTSSVIADDAYGRGPVRRSVTTFRGRVEPGNSGGPLVDASGRVAATVFASTVSGPRGGYAVPVSVAREAVARSSGPVSTGPCAR